jgi:hypothetical protein
MRHPLDQLQWLPGTAHQALRQAWSMAEKEWRLYPVHGVDAEGVCACPRRTACPDPGKHPTTPHVFNDASSDPERTAEMFTRWPGNSVGLKTGRDSGVAVLDVDPRDGGFASLRKLEAKYDKLPTTREHTTGGGGAHLLYAFPEGLGSG